jgi:nucleoside diphosphate kinase
MVWEGLNATKVGRDMLGATNPQASAPGTFFVYFLRIHHVE